MKDNFNKNKKDFKTEKNNIQKEINKNEELITNA